MKASFLRRRSQQEIEADEQISALMPDHAERVQAQEEAYQWLAEMREYQRQTPQEQSRAEVEEVLACLMRPMLGLQTTLVLSTEFGSRVGTEPEPPAGPVYAMHVNDLGLSSDFEGGRYADQLLAAGLRILAGKLLRVDPPGVYDVPSPEFIATLGCLVARVEANGVFVDRLQAFALQQWGLSTMDVMAAMQPVLNASLFGPLESLADWRLSMPGEMLELYDSVFNPAPEPVTAIATRAVTDEELLGSPECVGGDAEWGIDDEG